MDPTYDQERLAYESVILKIKRAEDSISDPIKRALADYRQLLTVILFKDEDEKRKYIEDLGLHLWIRDEIMKYPRFEVKPYSFYGLVDRSSFGDHDPEDSRKGTIEIMDILPGFAVVSVPPSDYLQEMKKVYRGVTGMTPENLKVVP